MKNKLFLILFLGVFMNSCQKENYTVIDQNNPVMTARSAYDFDGACDDETWDGDINHDCAPPATNCVVICGTRSANQYYSQFTSAVTAGTAKDFYQYGNGQSFMQLSQNAYSDLINGSRDFVKVTAAINPVKYALY